MRMSQVKICKQRKPTLAVIDGRGMAIYIYEAVDGEIWLQRRSVREVFLAIKALYLDSLVESKVDEKDRLPGDETGNTGHIGEPP